MLNLTPPTSSAKNQQPETINNRNVPQLDVVTQTDPMKVIQAKYYETLYIAKTPLVYFAKSNLSRIRSRCKEEFPSSKKRYLNRLLSTLNSLILSIYELDLKYDFDWLSSFIKSDISSSSHPLGPKFSDLEMTCLANWKSHIEFSDSSQAKKSIDELKLRDIQLQIIILLEILAVEEKNPKKTKQADSQNPVTFPQATGLIRRRKKHKKESKSSNGTPAIQPDMLVDILFDRLCIWQALNEAAPTKVNENKDATPTDKILEFCHEVILPYFGSRLPVKTKAMLKKVSGSSLVKKHTGKPSAEKGIELKEQPVLGRELEPEPEPEPEPAVKSLSGANVNLQQSTKILRGGLVASSKNDQERRQVDMTSRQRSNMEAQEELEMAIRNISKPNRMSIADEIAKSRQMIVEKTSILKRRAPAKVVQVVSTPVKKRTISIRNNNSNENDDIVLVTPAKKVKSAERQQQEEDVIKSSPANIPATPLRTKTDSFLNANSPSSFKQHIRGMRRKLGWGEFDDTDDDVDLF
jgi:hypothetical protein